MSWPALASNEAIAERIGRSCPQVTNILNRQFGASRNVVRHVLELAKPRKSIPMKQIDLSRPAIARRKGWD
jgi:hypothetical protein